MEWRHSGSPPPPKKNLFAKIRWKSSHLDCLGSRRHPLIDYFPNDQTINQEYYSSLLVQLKDILKEKCRRKVTKGILFFNDNAPAHRALETQKKLGLPGVPVSWSPTLFSGSGLVGLPLVLWTEKTIERSPFFVRRGGHCCRGDLVWPTTFWICF